MANKYKHLSDAARAERAKARMCTNKRAFPTEEAAFQKGQKSYQCVHCGMWHRTGKMGKFIVQMTKKKKRPADKPKMVKFIKLPEKIVPQINLVNPQQELLKIVGLYVEKHTFVGWLSKIKGKEYSKKLRRQMKTKTAVTSLHAEYDIYGYAIFDSNFKQIFSATNNRLKPETKEYVELGSKDAMTLDEIEAYSKKKGKELADKRGILFIGSDLNEERDEDHVLSYSDVADREEEIKLKQKATVKVKDWTALTDAQKAAELTKLIEEASASLKQANDNVGSISIVLKLNPQLGASGIVDSYMDLHGIVNQYGRKLHEIKEKLSKIK